VLRGRPASSGIIPTNETCCSNKQLLGAAWSSRFERDHPDETCCSNKQFLGAVWSSRFERDHPDKRTPLL
jgi:hypothetical protein